MKKVLLLLVAMVTLATAANAQQAIGVRGAFGSGSGAELSYQTGMTGNRLELDLGWRSYKQWGSYINVTGVYQFLFDLPSNFALYAGVGANVGFYTDAHDDALGLGVVAQLGVQYAFQAVPFQISLDARPQWDVLGAASGFGYGLALGIRYTF